MHAAYSSQAMWPLIPTGPSSSMSAPSRVACRVFCVAQQQWTVQHVACPIICRDQTSLSQPGATSNTMSPPIMVMLLTHVSASTAKLLSDKHDSALHGAEVESTSCSGLLCSACEVAAKILHRWERRGMLSHIAYSVLVGIFSPDHSSSSLHLSTPSFNICLSPFGSVLSSSNCGRAPEAGSLASVLWQEFQDFS